MSISPIRGPRALVALGVLALALAAAGPAGAEPSNSRQTVKHGCILQTGKDQATAYPHGSTLTVNWGGGKDTLRCNDGNWEKVKAIYVRPNVTVSASALTSYPGR
jgi:hypothetical protein